MRATDPSRATITRADIEAAQAVIDAWCEYAGTPPDAWQRNLIPHLRGLITTAITTAITDAHAQGVARGRRDIANTVRDALDGEGV